MELLRILSLHLTVIMVPCPENHLRSCYQLLRPLNLITEWNSTIKKSQGRTWAITTVSIVITIIVVIIITTAIVNFIVYNIS